MTTEEKIAAITAFIETVDQLALEAAEAHNWREMLMHRNDVKNLIKRRDILRMRLAAEQVAGLGLAMDAQTPH